MERARMALVCAIALLGVYRWIGLPALRGAQGEEIGPPRGQIGVERDWKLLCPSLQQHENMPFTASRSRTASQYIVVHEVGVQRNVSLDVEEIGVFASRHARRTVVSAGGKAALYFASLKFETHAFEPRMLDHSLLECGSIANDFASAKQLMVYDIALGDGSDGTICVAYNRPRDPSHVPLEIGVDACSRRVPVAALDDIVARRPQSFGRDAFALLSIEDGSAAPSVLGGARKTLANPHIRPRLVHVGVSGEALRAKGLQPVQELLEHGYGIVHPLTARDRLALWIAQAGKEEQLLFASPELISPTR